VANRELAKKILQKGGCLLSEFESDFKATDFSFPQRNRIMAGLAHATLVIEAQTKSGTLITSKYATEYNRDVLAVPGSIFSTLSEGPHMLIRLGATPITTAEDLRQALGFENKEKQMKLEIDKENLSPEELQVVNILTSPIPRDELIDALDMKVSEAQALLGVMEIKGIITETGGEVRLV
jgi:DNA processing protein